MREAPRAERQKCSEYTLSTGCRLRRDTKHEPYRDLGVTYFDERDRQAVERRLVKRLQSLGYDVSLRPLAAA